MDMDRALLNNGAVIDKDMGIVNAGRSIAADLRAKVKRLTDQRLRGWFTIIINRLIVIMRQGQTVRDYD